MKNAAPTPGKSPKTSRKGQIRHAGFLWKLDGDTYVAEHDDQTGHQLTLNVWNFGSIWQNVIHIQDNCQFAGPMERRMIGLQHQPTCREAMQNCVDYLPVLAGPVPTVNQTIAKGMEEYPTLYAERIHVLNHLLVTIGNGFDWLRGALWECSPQQKAEEDCQAVKNFIKRDPEKADRILNRKRPLRADPDGDHSFYPLSNYSNINNIPHNVNDDWLSACIETAQFIRDRAGIVNWEKSIVAEYGSGPLTFNMINAYRKREEENQAHNRIAAADTCQSIWDRFGDPGRSDRLFRLLGKEGLASFLGGSSNSVKESTPHG